MSGDEAPAVYVVRGEVVALPEAGKPGSAFEVHHEAIDDFIRQDGTRGMNAMTMEFPLAPGASMEGVGVGDIVKLTFEVTMRPRISWRATKIEKLPPDTKLEFRVATPSHGQK